MIVVHENPGAEQAGGTITRHCCRANAFPRTWATQPPAMETIMKLTKSEYCPIHRSRSCCGRKTRNMSPKYRSCVRRVIDQSNPRGYRELRSPAEMKRLLPRKVVESERTCGICGRPFTDFRDIVPDHIRPKGMGGARLDDRPRGCNLKKGSKRL